MANIIWDPGISGSNPTVELVVNQQSQNITDNYSVLEFSLVLHRPSAVYSSASKSFYVNINGVTVASGSTTIGGSGDKLITSGTTVVHHNPDGTKTGVPFDFYMDIGITWSGQPTGDASGSGGIDLTPIPRATTPTLNYSTREMGQSINISVAPASSGFSHKLYYAFSGVNNTLIATLAAGNQTKAWTIPTATLAPKIPNATSGTVTIVCETYSGAALIGTTQVTFTVTVPDYQPSASLALTGVDLYSGKYVQGKSKVTVAVTSAGLYGSTIASISSQINGAAYNTAGFTTDLLATAGTNTVQTTVSDSRGKARTVTQNIAVVAYSAPTITTLTAIRCNSDGTPNQSGAYIKATLQASIAPIDNTNTKQTKLYYKRKIDSTWSTALTNTTDYAPNQSVVFAADGNYSYDVKLEVTDYYGMTPKSIDVGTAFTLMDFHKDGKSMAIGKVAEGNDLLDIKGNVRIDGLLKMMNTAGVLTSLIDLFFPINKIEMTEDNINPGTRFPGTTWIAWGQGRVPLGVGSIVANTDTSEGTVVAGSINKTSGGILGGEKTHTLTTNEMPTHSHSVVNQSTQQYVAAMGSDLGLITNSGASQSGSAGGGKAHNIMQAYATCYFWKRTA